jgi:hypothetical protein
MPLPFRNNLILLDLIMARRPTLAATKEANHA